MPTDEELIQAAYAAFNRRDLEALFSMLHPDVVWANGMAGGYVIGHDALREYWTGQWRQLDPHVEPREVRRDERGLVHVAVHQLVRDLAGTVLADRQVEHVYQLDAGLVRRMEIVEDTLGV